MILGHTQACYTHISRKGSTHFFYDLSLYPKFISLLCFLYYTSHITQQTQKPVCQDSNVTVSVFTELQGGAGSRESDCVARGVIIKTNPFKLVPPTAT